MMLAISFGGATTATDFFSLRVEWSGINFMRSFTNLFSS
jgi:hypothetical protein